MDLEIFRDFNKQFEFEPKINNLKNLKKSQDLFLAGMGGSHLSADLIKSVYPQLNLKIHSNYGLPQGINKESLLIVSSFSGNTEETIDSLDSALKKKIPVIIISSGGKLIEISKEKNLPYILLPNTINMPRLAIGFSLKAILKIINKKVSIKIDNSKAEKEGKKIAEKIYKTIPIIYSSEKNKSVANIWKINFNENSKNPSFCNYFPELNHNEMAGFLNSKKTFSILMLEDELDHPKIKIRMNAFREIYKDSFEILTIKNKEKDIWNKYFYLILLSNWTSYYLALKNKVKLEDMEMIERFKKMISL